MGHLASSGICALLPFLQITINFPETDKMVSIPPFFTVVVVTIPQNFLLRDKITRNVVHLEFRLSRAMICLLWTASPGVVTMG